MSNKIKNTLQIPLKLDSIKVIKSEYINNEYHIKVKCTAKSVQCDKCNKTLTKFHGSCEETIIEHMPLFDERVFIYVTWPRFYCPSCDKTKSFKAKWVGSTGKYTERYEHFFMKMLTNTTVKDVAEKFNSTESIIEGLASREISTEVDWSQLNVKRMGIDEIALRKGHSHYLTIITDISEVGKTQILGVIDGRKKEDVIPFLKSIPRENLLAMEAICVDMGASFFMSLKEVINDDKIFESIVTIDRFHVSKILGKAFDEQRKFILKELTKKYAGDEEVLDVLKNSMWPLRHHFDDISDPLKEKVEKICDLSPDLKNCYKLREDLYAIFETNSTKDQARSLIQNWLEKAESLEVGKQKPFASFVKTYRCFAENILNFFTLRASSGAVEGLNNKIKAIKRRGYGFRNVASFARRLFLDINKKSYYMKNFETI